MVAARRGQKWRDLQQLPGPVVWTEWIEPVKHLELRLVRVQSISALPGTCFISHMCGLSVG